MCQVVQKKIFSTDFRKVLKYHTSWKSVQWEPTCFKRKDETHSETNSLFARTCLKNLRSSLQQWWLKVGYVQCDRRVAQQDTECECLCVCMYVCVDKKGQQRQKITRVTKKWKKNTKKTWPVVTTRNCPNCLKSSTLHIRDSFDLTQVSRHKAKIPPKKRILSLGWHVLQVSETQERCTWHLAETPMKYGMAS
jgi:hypothetical protein